ncbi:MAG: ABC transporter permease [Verrucomicrobiota bacterium]
MTIARFILRGMLCYWRTNLGVLLGSLLASMILTGSLLVGDSVKYSLTQIALARLGDTRAALISSEGFFREQLASQINAKTAPALLLRGTVALPDGSARANGVQIVGVDERFWKLRPKSSPEAAMPKAIDPDGFLANDRLVGRLGLKPGDAVVIRVEEPSLLSRDAPLSGASDASIAIRSRMRAIIGADRLGHFSLQSNQVPPLTLFLPLHQLQEALKKPSRANVLLTSLDAPSATARLRETWSLDDLNLQVRALPDDHSVELRTERVFLEPGIASAAMKAAPQAQGVLTYLVNEIRFGEHATPYSMVAAQEWHRRLACEGARGTGKIPIVFGIAFDEDQRSVPYQPGATPRENWEGELGLKARTIPGAMRWFGPSALDVSKSKTWGDAPGWYGVAPLALKLHVREQAMFTPNTIGETPVSLSIPKLADDEIAINSWLAEDLGAKVGDELSLRYYVVAGGRQLSEKTSRFRVRSIFPLERPDPSWMPPYPGLADVENCRDWQPGIPVETSRIRPKDEEYWKIYRGTPKAFISLGAGQAIWGNRFGNLTAIRFPDRSAEEVERSVRASIDPVKAGLVFQPVRDAALKASSESQDFGQLFIGFSFFLIVAALLLMAMLFVFNLEQRTTEAGVLLALGFTPGRVRGLLLIEGYAIATFGAGVGVVAGALYTKAALHGLSTVWQAAVHLPQFEFHQEPITLVIGGFSSLLAGWVATWIAGRGHVRRPVANLLASGAELELRGASGNARRSVSLALASLLIALIPVIFGGRSAEAFFGAGALLLIAGIAASHAGLLKLGQTIKTAEKLAIVGLRGAARRCGRSLTILAVLASGVFMVVAVGAFRGDPLAHASERGSGTGGFAFIGQSTLPIYEDLNSPAGQQAFGLTPESMQGVGVVPMRVKDGDDASCLNLNRAQQPRFLGVRPESLGHKNAFTFIDRIAGATTDSGWELLDRVEPDGAVPAIGDEATVRWALDKAVGKRIECTDERGQVFSVRIVGVLANSVLQGSLVISDKAFVQRFPSASGSRAFLIDARPEKAIEVAKAFSSALQNRGMEVVPAWQRLAEFQAVENSYLSIFQALGGLGLLLGSAGFGIVVMRNVCERRNELALLQAIGYSKRRLRWLVVSEHGALIILGTGIGSVAAAVSIAPSLAGPGGHGPGVGFAATVLLLAAGGIAWSWLAAWFALRGPLLDSLRNE